MTRIATVVLAASVAFAGACSQDEDPSKLAAEEAKVLNEQQYKGKVVEVKAPVPGGTKIPCDEVIELEEFDKFFEPEGPEKLTLVLEDQTDKQKNNPEINSMCAIVRPGEPPSKEEQEKALKDNLTLGVLPGEAWCYVLVECSIITTEERFEKACKGRNSEGKRDLGQFACVKTMIRGPNDAFNYRVLDRDTMCAIEVRGGHAVTDETIVQNCTRAALESLDPEDIAKYQQ